MSSAQRRFRVAGKDLILDFSEYDVNHVIADQEEIRRFRGKLAWEGDLEVMRSDA